MKIEIEYANTPAGRRLKKQHAQDMRDLLTAQRAEKKRIKADAPKVWKGWGWACARCGITTPTPERMSRGKQPIKPPWTSPHCDGCKENHTDGKIVRIKMAYV